MQETDAAHSPHSWGKNTHSGYSVSCCSLFVLKGSVELLQLIFPLTDDSSVTFLYELMWCVKSQVYFLAPGSSKKHVMAQGMPRHAPVPLKRRVDSLRRESFGSLQTCTIAGSLPLKGSHADPVNAELPGHPRQVLIGPQLDAAAQEAVVRRGSLRVVDEAVVVGDGNGTHSQGGGRGWSREREGADKGA